ncbi:hypothetical protein DAMA08_028220 [Martiniozyma asiatica (nom. inval.)]|nr:hypothetical protein DAMA08_028220 [Martiniozyma asiatica]
MHPWQHSNSPITKDDSKRKRQHNLSSSNSKRKRSRLVENGSGDSSSSDSIPPEVLHRLQTFSLFSDAPPSFFTALARSLRLVQYRPQEYIVKFGEPAKSMYWILRGTVGVTSTDGESIYAELVAGSFFGEIGILFNRPRTATVVARTRVLVGVLTKDALSIVLGDYPKIERIIRDEGQERLAMQEKRKRLTRMTLPTISKRVSVAPPPLMASLNFNSNSNSNSNSNAISNSTLALAGQNDEGIVINSLVANDHDCIPGPSVPPVPINFYSGNNDLDWNEIDNVDETISTRQFLYNLHIFTTLSRDIIHELVLKVDVMRFHPMEYIFKKGDFGRDIYFIVYGEVDVLNNNAVIARLGPGKYFGEMAFLSTLTGTHKLQKRSADLRTITDCEILLIKDETLDALCDKYPSVMEDMKKTALERIQKNDSSEGNEPQFKNFNWGQTKNIEDEFNSELDLPSKPESKLLARFKSASEIYQTDLYKDKELDEMKSLDTDTDTGAETATESCFSEVQFKSFSFSNRAPTHSITPTPAPTETTKDNKLSNNTEETPPNTHNNRNSLPQLFTMPPLNPRVGLLDRFTRQSRSSFHYTPLDHRIRLSEINKGRRRSSFLNIGPFPDSITIKIFKLLDLPTLLRLSRVCSRWKQLIYLSNDLMKELDLSKFGRYIDDDSIISITNVVGSRPEIINISNCYHITDVGFSYMINEIGLKGLIKQLTMKNNWNISAMAIMDLSVAGRSLEILDLSNCRKVKDDVIIRLIGYKDEFKFGCKKLTKLNLGYCKYLTDQSMKHISINLPNLLELDLSRCTTITDLGFISWLGNKLSIQKLILRDCTFLSDKAIEAIPLTCPNLNFLDLTFCCMLTDLSLHHLSNCSNLDSLNVSFCGAAVSDYSLYELTRLEKLKKLNIKGCVRVTREGVDIALGMNLDELWVVGCPLRDVYRGKTVKSLSGWLKVGPSGRIVKVWV